MCNGDSSAALSDVKHEHGWRYHTIFRNKWCVFIYEIIFNDTIYVSYISATKASINVLRNVINIFIEMKQQVFSVDCVMLDTKEARVYFTIIIHFIRGYLASYLHNVNKKHSENANLRHA